MILKWTQSRVLSVSPVAIKGKSLTLKRETIILTPGINEITDHEFEGIKGQVSHLIASGALLVVETKVDAGEGKEPKVVTNFKDLPLAQARKLIGETTNPEVLQSWLADDRAEVSAAVRKRMEALELNPDFIKAAEDSITKE